MKLIAIYNIKTFKLSRLTYNEPRLFELDDDEDFMLYKKFKTLLFVGIKNKSIGGRLPILN